MRKRRPAGASSGSLSGLERQPIQKMKSPCPRRSPSRPRGRPDRSQSLRPHVHRRFRTAARCGGKVETSASLQSRNVRLVATRHIDQPRSERLIPIARSDRGGWQTHLSALALRLFERSFRRRSRQRFLSPGNHRWIVHVICAANRFATSRLIAVLVTVGFDDRLVLLLLALLDVG